MEILRSLNLSNHVKGYEVQDYKRWSEGFYYKLKIEFADGSVLFAREYIDLYERNYAFHWQDKENNMLMRWDNAPHHHNISTFPHHIHCDNDLTESIEVTLQDVIKIIEQGIPRL